MSIITWNEGWAVLRDGLDEIWRRCEANGNEKWKLSNREYLHLYSMVYDMCKQANPNNFSEKMYNSLIQYSINLVTFKIAPKIRDIDDPRKIMLVLQKEYIKYQKYIQTNHKVFCYLERYHCKSHQVLPPLEAQRKIFFEQLVHPHLKTIVEDLLIAEVSAPLSEYAENKRALMDQLSWMKETFSISEQLITWLNEQGLIN